MRILGLIPARGGSKGVPRKNVRSLGGRPLLAHTADAALGSRRLSRIVLSTEDEGVAETGRNCGLEVPFLRPAELARDESPMLPVVVHALNWMREHGEDFDAVCLLQPTSPLRRSEDIDACVDLLEGSDADAVVSVLPVPSEHNPHWVYFREDGGRLRLALGEASPIPRRQDLPPAFCREGSVYLTRCGVVLAGSLYGSRLLGYPIEPARSVNIDTPEDWDRAEALLASLGTKAAC